MEMRGGGGGETGWTTASTGPPAAPPAWLPGPPAGQGRGGRILGWMAAAAIVGSVLLMIAISAAGPSALGPGIPPAPPVPPPWVPLAPPPPAATGLISAPHLLGA